MRKPVRRSSSPVLVLAVSASVVFHVLLALFLLREGAPPSEPAHAPVPLELLFTESTPAPKPPAPPPVAPSPPRARPIRRPGAVASAPSPQPPAPFPQPPSPVEPAPAQAPLASDMPLLGAPVAQRPTLLPSMPALAPVPELPPEELAGVQAPTRLSPEAMVRDAVNDTMAQARQERGLVHPYFHELGQVLFAAWHPEPALEKVSAQTLASRDSLHLQDTVQAWRKRAEVYGKTGSPLSDMKVDQPLPSLGPVDLAPAFAAQAAMVGQVSKDLNERRFALVRLTQDRHGRLVDLRLLKPSLHPEMDRAALRDFRAVGQTLPVPPELVLGSNPTLVSLWELELIRGWNTAYQDTSSNFSEALALAQDSGASKSSWSKHLRFAGSR